MSQPPVNPLLSNQDRAEYEIIKVSIGCLYLKPSITTTQSNARFTKRMCNLLFSLADLSKLENGIYLIIEKYVANKKCGFCKLIIFPPLSSGDFCNEDCYENRYHTIFSIIYSNPKYQKYWDKVKYDSWLLLDSPHKQKYQLKEINDVKERSLFREKKLNEFLIRQNRVSTTNACYSGFGTRGFCWSDYCFVCGPALKEHKFEKLEDWVAYYIKEAMQASLL